MNKVKIIGLLLLLGSVVLFPGCGGGSDDPGPNNNNDSEQARVLALMKSGTWKLTNLKVDGADHTSSFQGMTLNFTDAGYTTTNGKEVWPSTGTWQFARGSSTSITRNDGTVITIDAIADAGMTL